MWEIDLRGTGPAIWATNRRAVAVRFVRSRPGRPTPLTVVAAVGLVVAAGLAVFGMPPVDLHSPLHHLGIMDPLCGMTRGSAAMMRGDLREAWWYNPASPAVIAGGFVLVARWVVGRFTGRWVDVRVRATPLVVAVVGLALVALEVNQQLHVARLR
jgi:Protein of unknown function (DUF2752)